MIFLTGLLIVLLVFTNAITDAPNAISTVVGTKVMSFRKAAFLSGWCNFIGIVIMCFINFNVAKNIATLICFETGKNGIIIVFSSILSTIIFSVVALKYGIPTSETHGLIAGLTGASLVFGNIQNINFGEWEKVLIGLVWSIFCTYIICKLLNVLLVKVLDKIKKRTIKIFQCISCLILSIMHGAQDGLKFIGIFIIYFYSIQNMDIDISAQNNFWIIILIASIMSIGVGFGGRTIVENIGSNITCLSNKDAIITDISTGITLFFASFLGIPVSTSHCKTVSIISIGNKLNKKVVIDIFKAWIITFPICFLLSYIFAKILTIDWMSHVNV